MILISGIPNQTSFSHFDLNQNYFSPFTPPHPPPKKKKKEEKQCIKQQNKTETVIEFKLSVNLAVFWSPGENTTKTSKHSGPSLTCLARACCTEVKSNGKVSVRKKREPVEILGSVILQEQKQKSQTDTVADCSQDDVLDFCNIWTTGVTLSKWLLRPCQYHRVHLKSNCILHPDSKKGLKLSSEDNWINHSFIHWFIHSNQAILNLLTGIMLDARCSNHKQGKVPSLSNDLKYRHSHMYHFKGLLMSELEWLNIKLDETMLNGSTLPQIPYCCQAIRHKRESLFTYINIFMEHYLQS